MAPAIPGKSPATVPVTDSTATVVQILTHNGDANARVIFDTDALDITIGASVSAGWVVLADRVEWVYDIEDYDLADEDDCVIPYRGKVIVRGNRTRASDVTPSDPMPSGDGRYVRFDGTQGLSNCRAPARRPARGMLRQAAWSASARCRSAPAASWTWRGRLGCAAS